MKVLSIIKPNIVLFVGDISDGSVKIIKKINEIKIPTFVILGNHDRGKDSTGETLSKQIRVLGEKYCAWDLKVFNNQINLLSARPCSSGGGYYLSKEVKAQSDLICTSSNAVALVKKIPEDKKIIFAPDQNLGRWVQKNSGRNLKLWPGSCIVHESFSEEALLKLKYQHPGSKVIAHPECSQNLLLLSDFIGSTSKLLDFVSKDPSKTYMVLTEPGIIHQMKKKEPNKIFIEVPDIEGCKCNECPYMKLNTLQKILDCLKNNSPSIELDPEIIRRAYVPIKRMLDMSN